MTYTVVKCTPPTRVTLLDDAGQGQVRWTLQDVNREGREVRFRLEGTLRTLGSGTGWRRRWTHQGFRQELALKWAFGLTSSREAWDGSAWSSPTERPTAEAHMEILSWGAERAVSVEPFLGEAMPTFKAQGTENGPSLRDTKGVAHPMLELVLRSVVPSRSLVLVKTGRARGWGLGPWGLMAWGIG